MQLVRKLEFDNYVRRIADNDSSLVSLNLRHYGIEDEDAIVLAKALKKNSYLKELDLSQNEIGSNGAIAIAKALGKQRFLGFNLSPKSQLQVLRMSEAAGSNYWSDEAAFAFAEAIKANTKIELLDISNNKIGYNGGRALAEALEINQVIEQIYFFPNYSAMGELSKRNGELATKHVGRNIGIKHSQNTERDEWKSPDLMESELQERQQLRDPTATTLVNNNRSNSR